MISLPSWTPRLVFDSRFGPKAVHLSLFWVWFPHLTTGRKQQVLSILQIGWSLNRHFEVARCYQSAFKQRVSSVNESTQFWTAWVYWHSQTVLARLVGYRANVQGPLGGLLGMTKSFKVDLLDPLLGSSIHVIELDIVRLVCSLWVFTEDM